MTFFKKCTKPNQRKQDVRYVKQIISNLLWSGIKIEVITVVTKSY